MSVVALAIDALLPALDLIGISIGTIDASQNQLIISMIFLGLGIKKHTDIQPQLCAMLVDKLYATEAKVVK